jgi:MOSC domain-containing protein YiiM
MKVRHIFISPGHNYFGHHGQPPGTAPMIELEVAEVVAGKGIVGDRFFDWKVDYKGQVTFFSAEVYDELCARLGVWDKPSSAFRRNFIVENADLNACIGRDFEIQGVGFRGTAECSPCHWMNQAFAPGAERALHGRGGLRAMVLTSGLVRREA